MSVLRQLSIFGGGRLDVPHIRSIDSSVCRDFDVLVGNNIAGEVPLVVTGFYPIVTGSTPGSDPSNLQVYVANGTLLHPLASESGTIYLAPSDREPETLNASNARVQGGFTSGATNYVGLDLRRTADASTSDIVQFINVDTNTETPKEVPLGRTLDYVIVVSTQSFDTTPGLAPLFKVVTDSNGQITSGGVIDCRNFWFRLGSGGSVPNPDYAFPWANGRTENGDNTDFTVADKSISSLKQWMDAIMTRLWEVGGGEHWYSPTEDRNVKMVRSGTTFTNGDWFSWDGTNLLWKGITFIFNNSTGGYNQVADQIVTQAGLTNLANGECLYVDLDFSENRSGGTALVAVKATFEDLGSPTVPGSRWVMAWRWNDEIFTRDAQFNVNATFYVATTVSTGVVKLSKAALTPSSPIVLADSEKNAFNGVAALDSVKSVIGFGLERDVAGTLAIGTGANTVDMTIGSSFVTGGLRIRALSNTQLRAKSLSSSAAAVTVYDLNDSNTNPNHTIFEVIGTNAGPTFQVLGITDKGMLFNKAFATPATPATDKVIVYLTDNGLSTPNRRQRLVVMWDNGSTTTIAESPAT